MVSERGSYILVIDHALTSDCVNSTTLLLRASAHDQMIAGILEADKSFGSNVPMLIRRISDCIFDLTIHMFSAEKGNPRHPTSEPYQLVSLMDANEDSSVPHILRSKIKHLWNMESAQISDSVRRYLWAKLPARPDIHDDLVNETLLSLWKYIIENPEKSLRLSERKTGDAVFDQKYLHFLSQVILRHRIADHFRKQGSRLIDHLDISAMPNLVDPHEPGAEVRYFYKEALAVCIRELAKMSRADREMFLSLAGVDPFRSGGPGLPVSDADRQRLSRLRRKLKSKIEEQIGEPIESLFEPSSQGKPK